MTESGKVEVVDIKFGNKTYENVSVKHLNPTDEGSHSHKRTSKELGVKKKKSKKESVMSSKLEELVGKPITEEQFDEAAGKKDACYRKVKARYDVWPSAYASGALVKCRKVGAANWGNKSKKEGVNEASMELKKLEDAIKMFQKKIKKQGSVTNARDEDHLKNLIKVYKQMGGKGVKEGVNEMDSPMFKITYQDSNGRKKTDIMRAKNNNLAKRDFNALHKGRGFKILSVVKEGLGDRMSKKLKKLKGVNLKKKKVKRLKLKGRGVYQDYDGLKEDVFIETNTNGKMKTTHVYYESDGKGYGYTLEFVNELNEAEYQGRKVKLGKIMQGDVKKFKVYVKNPKGNVVKVNFGQGGDAKGGTMRIRKSNPKARKSFRARHNCDNPGPRHKARYWSCRKW